MTSEEYFIGLRKDRKSGEWRWISDGSTVNATRGQFPWATHEPSGNGNCAVMYKNYLKHFGKYSDLLCTQTYANPGYICERPAVSSGQEGMPQKSCFSVQLTLPVLFFCQVMLSPDFLLPVLTEILLTLNYYPLCFCY